MNTITQIRNLSQIIYFRYPFRHLFVIVCFVGSLLYGQPLTAFSHNPTCQPGLIPTVSGPDSVCTGTGGNVYITEPGMTNYIWSVSTGGAIISGLGTNNIVVSWSQAGAGLVTVTYATATSPGILDVTIFNVVTPSIAIAPNTNPVCTGVPVTFTATVVNGGTFPFLQWLVNGVPVGSNNNVFTYIPSNGDIVNCELTSNALCATSPQAVSVPVTMIVNPLQITGVYIAASSNPVCQGTQVALTAVPQQGGSSPSYQWKVNGLNSGTNAPTFSLVPANGDLVVCEMTSNAPCISGNPVVSNAIVFTVSPSQMVGATITPSSNPVCQNTSVTFSTLTVNGGASPQYLWKVNNLPVGTNASSFTYIPSNGDAVTCQLTSSASCAIGNPAISAPVTMIVNQVVPVSLSVQASSNPVCQGLPVTLNATPVNGGSMPVYQWTLNGFPVGTNNVSYTYIPANGDGVLCKLFSSVLCPSVIPAISNTVNMTVNPNMPVSVSISSSANPICVSSSVTLTATPFNGGTSPVYEWRVNGITVGANNVNYTFIPNNGDQVVCLMTSNAICSSLTPVVSNTITLTVSPQLPVSVSVLSSSNPVCQNIQVVYTASPVNGGTTPAYQWKVNGFNTGSNNPVFTYSPVDADHISCTLTSNLACVSGNPSNSNVITMTVIPSAGVMVSVAITSSSNPSCVGQQVTYIATAVNGGSAPVYSWTVNGLTVGSNSPTYTYAPSTGDFIRCWVTSDLTCATNNPAGSNEISMTVNPILPVSVSIISSSNPACLGTPLTFTANAVNPGSSPVYQWKVDGVNVGTNQNTLVYSPVNGNVITCKLTSSIGCVSGNPANSNAITMSVLPVLPVSISISTLTNPSCTGSQVTFSAAPSNGGTTPVFQWKLNGIVTGSNSPLLVFTPITGHVITCKLTSSALCYSGNKVANSNSIEMVVNPELAPAVNVSASSNPFCQGSPVTFTATPTNGGTLPVYQWRVNCQSAGTNNAAFSYSPAEGDYVTCQMTSNLTCAVMNPCKSNGISMRLNTETPAGISISTSANPVCPGTIVTYTGTATNGGTMPAYQWKVNGSNAGSNSPVFSYAPLNGDMVTCQLISNAPCVSGNPVMSNPLNMLVSPSLPASITISTPTNPFCTGTAVTFSALATNGGTAPNYQWKVNGLAMGTNLPTFGYFPTSGDAVICQLTSNASCISGTNPVSSNQIDLLSGSSIPVAISVNVSSNPVCAGHAATFTATHSGGGNNPVFVWHVNGVSFGVNSPVFTYTPVNGDIVNCTLTSDLLCGVPLTVLSNNTVMEVNPVLPVSVTITASANPCCVGTPVTFNATTQNGGVSPVYQWIVNCLNVGTNSPDYTYIPAPGDVVVCRVVSNVPCSSGSPAVSNNINMMVLPIQPVSVSILPSFNPFCLGNPITFTASPTNGGNAAVYQWQVNHINIGPNLPIFTYQPADGDTVVCILNSSAPCVSGNPAVSSPVVMMAIATLPVTISIAASANPICYTTLVAFTATTTNGGNSPDYQWKVNGINTGPNHYVFQYGPAIGDVVTCVLTTSLSCATPNPATSNPINMIVYPQAPVSVVATVSQNPTCQGTPVTFNAAVTNGGTSPVYRWRVNGNLVGTISPTYTYTPVNGDVVYCRVTSNATCATGNPSNSNQIIMNVSPITPSSLSIAPSANPVCAGSTVVFTATPVNGGTAPAYQWKVNGVNAGINSAVFSYPPLNGDQISCEMLSNSICTTILNATSNTIIMSVSGNQAVSVSVLPSVNPVCINTYVNYTAVPVNGGTSPQYQWKVDGTVVGTNSPTYSYIPVNGNVVTCKLTSGLSCTTGNPATSSAVIMSVNSSLPVGITLTPSANPSCQGQSIGYTALPLNGGISPVYQWMVNGINVGINSPVYSYVPAQGDYVNCQLTSDFSCATGNPVLSSAVVMDVNPNLPIAVSIVSSGNPVCIGSLVSYSATPVNGGASPGYQWKVNGISVGSNSPVFNYIPNQGDTVSCQMSSGIACPATNPVFSNNIVMNVVDPEPIDVVVSASQNPTCQGSQVTFTATPENGGYNPSYQWKLNGVNVGTGQASFSTIPADDDVVICILTSSASCISSPTVQSDSVIMVVSTELPVSVSVQASSNPVCLGQPVLYTSSVVNGGTAPSYQWMVNGINVGTNNYMLTFTPSDGDSITCLVTSDFTCATGNPAISDPVIMSVTFAVPAGINIAPSANPVCLGSNVTFTAIVTNAGSSPVFQWEVNGINIGGNQATFNYIPANGDLVSCLLTATDPCSAGNPVNSNQVVMTVSSDLPVSINIVASVNQVCAGTPVTFTALAENGGSSPVFQWKVNNINVGVNASSYTCIPSDGDQVRCILTSGLSCATGNPASSNVITMIVNLQQTVSVAISANPSGSVCAGTTVLMTANPTNGGTSPSYQWFKNGNLVGANQSTYNFIPSNGDLVYVTLSSNLLCSIGNPAVSATATMAVTDPLAVSVSVEVSQNNFCEGTPVTFTATPVNGGVPSFQWFVNGLASGMNQSSYTSVPANGDIVYVTMTTSLSCVTAPTVNSNTISMNVNSLLPVSVTIVADQNPICQGSMVTLTATPVNGGIPFYQWFLNGMATGFNQPVFSFVPGDGDQVYVQMTSDLTCVINPTAVSNVILMTVNLPLTVGVGITVNQNPVCKGTEVTFDAIPVNGGNPSFQWYKNNLPVGFNQSHYICVPDDGDQVYVAMNSTLSCVSAAIVNSEIVIMTVGSIMPVSVTIDESQNNVCEGTSVVYTATGINGGNPVYKWFRNGNLVGASFYQYVCIPIDGDEIYVEMSSDITCGAPITAVSNVVVMVVNPVLPIGVSIVSDNNHVCSGTAVTITATPLNGGVPGFHWFKNGLPVGTNQAVFSYIPENGDEVYVEMTTSLICVNAVSVNSETVVMIVDMPLEVAVSITSDQNEVCEGMPMTFTALSDNGGLPFYQWFRNDIQVGSNDVQYSCIPEAGDHIYVEMTSSLVCVNNRKVISNQLSPAIRLFPEMASAITGPSSVCGGSEGVVFSILPVVGAVSYTWQLPLGVTIVSGEHEKEITLNFSGSSTLGGLSVKGNNLCGSGGFSPVKQVQVFPIPEIPLIVREGNTITSSVLAGNQWYFEGVLIRDSIGSTISPKQLGWYWSFVTENGCSSDTSNHIFFDGVFPGPITSEPGFWVYPVPNNGQFTVAISLPSEDTFDVTVYNSLGVQLYQIPDVFVHNKFKQVIDLRPKMPKGLYAVIFKCDDYQVIKKMLIYNR